MNAFSTVHFAFAPDVPWFAGDLAVKATLVLVAAAAFTWAAQRSAAALRHRLWCMAYLALLMLPALSFALPKWTIPIPAGAVNTFSKAARIPIAGANEESTSSRSPDAATKVEPAAPSLDEQSADKLSGDPLFAADRVRAPLRRQAGLSEGRPEIAVPARGDAIAVSTDSALGPGLLRGGLVVLWLLGVGAYSFHAYTGYRASARLARSAEPVRDRQWLELLEQARSSLSVPARVELCETDAALTPMVAGILRPKILLPRDGQGWPVSLRRHVLIHELAHVKRRDLLLQLVGRLATALYWFHPLAWYGLRRMQVEREIACDDYVLTVVERPSDYAAQLLEFARRMRGIIHSWAACMANESTLEERVKSMLDRRRSHRPLSSWAAQTLFATAVGGAALLALAQPGLQADVDDRASKQPFRVPATLPGQAQDATSVSVAVADEKSASHANTAAPNASSNVAGSPPQADPTKSLSDDLVTITGRVLLPDGSPAANAVVSATGYRDESSMTVGADADGHFRVSHPFGTLGWIYARTPDWRQQASLSIPRFAAPSTLNQPVEMKLAPATARRVLVRSGGNPAEGVRLVAWGAMFYVEGQTGRDGVATLWLPAGKGFAIDAWHPQLGQGAARFFGKKVVDLPADVVELSLFAPKTHTIRVVDPEGKPVADLRFSIVCRRPSDEWPSTERIDEATLKTDSRGEITVPWIPADVEHVGLVRIFGPWIVDQDYRAGKPKLGLTTIQVRRLQPVMGRLIMPPGAKPEGIVVNGDGVVKGRGRHSPRARVRQDGTFTFLAAPEYGYLLAISDPRWASDPWTGVVLTSDTAKPVPITLKVYPAIPLTVRATRGPQAEPWAGVSVRATKFETLEWTDAHGRTQNGSGVVADDRTTDTAGTAMFAIGRGKYGLHFWSGDWMEEQTITATSDAPVSITVHRPWLEKRQITGRITQGNKPRVRTPTTTLRAWVSRNGTEAVAETTLLPDGRFTVAGNSADVYLLVTDSKEHLAACRHIGPKDPTTNIYLNFERPGIYSGEVVDAKGKPAAGCRVRLIADTYNAKIYERHIVLDEIKCDDRGRFKFDKVPARVPLCVSVVRPSADQNPRHPMVEHELELKPGEVFEDDRLRIRPEEPESAIPALKNALKKSVADRLPGLIRDARLAHMRVLIAAKGDSTKPVHDAVQKLFKEEEFREILHYLPVEIDAENLPAEAALFRRLNLRPPEAGKILLIVADRDGQSFDAISLEVDDVSSAFNRGAEFLKKHAPASRDARKLLAAAQKEARATGRRVWVIEGGPRCGPCFRLARWLDEQHSLLEKDYVFVKLLEICDEGVDDVMKSVNGSGGGIPWFAITDPGGTVLATSDSPVGNIGFPDDRLGKRHLRSMLQRTAQKLTSDEVDRLIHSLGG